MSSEVEAPKREPTPTPTLSSIPQKRVLDELNSSPAPASTKAESNLLPSNPSEDVPLSKKSVRAKKDTLKKREAKGIDSGRATPDPKAANEPRSAESGPLRYKLAPPKLSDFDLPRGPVLTVHHEVQGAIGHAEFFETSDQ